MLCEKCHEREATIFYTEIINGVKNEHSLCSECGILGAYAVESEKKEDTMEQVVCPTCKLSYRDFISQGVLGCEDCYNVFEPLIEGNIKKIQGNTIHTGKKPLYNHMAGMTKPQAEYSVIEEIQILKEKLKEALMEEDYEEAASLRDEIKALRERDGIDA